MADLTPMMRQYLEIKEQNKDSILFFRLGDFYEMFNEDAKLAARELDLVLTTRDRGKSAEEQAPMCGIPYHSSDGYIARLIAKGYKVAICEQTEDPALAKGLVKRDIIRVVTPGTVIDSACLDDRRGNFLCGVFLDEQNAGVAFCDMSTGHTHVTAFSGADRAEHLCNELARFSPAEAVLSAGAYADEELKALLADRLSCRVERGGVLRSRKSLAVAGRELPASALTEMDMENLSRAREYGVTALMQPFVRGADDLRAVRAALRETGAQELKIFAKIENMTGLHRLDEILPLADVVVIARGDLGNAMPLWELPRAQTLIASKCRAAKRPFMVSTQMLHSMHHAAVPTRAEVTDVYQAARSGADYLLLTGETAVGEYPVEAMTYFAKIAANGWADAE